MAYLYRHIKLDTNQPFYIGVGGLDKFDNYLRAYTLSGRNTYWKRIVKKYGFEYEILIDDLSLIEAFSKEREFVKLYGRINIKTGILVNMTDGGEGSPGTICSPETRLKMSKSRKGKLLHENTEKVLKLISESRKGKTRDPKIVEKMRNSTKGKYIGSNNGFYGKTHSKEVLEKHSKIVLNTETGIFYDSAKEASVAANIGYSFFRSMLNGRTYNKTNFKYVSSRTYDKQTK